MRLLSAIAALVLVSSAAQAADAGTEFSLGTSAMQENDLKAAAAHFHAAVLASPTSKEAEQSWVNLGLIAMQRRDAKEAIASYDAALKLKDDAKAWNGKGIALLTEGRADDAVKAFEASSKADPRDPTPWNNLGKLSLAAGDPQRAEEFYLMARQIDGANGDAMVGLANVLIARGKFKDAAVQAESATRLDAENGAAWNALGQARVADGDYGGAIPPLRKAVELAPDQEMPHLNLAIALYNAAEYAAAGLALADANELAPMDPAVHLYAGLCYFRLGKVAAADEECDHALKLGADGRDKAVALYTKGLAAEDSEDWARAEKLYRASEQTDKEHYPQAANNLGLILQRKKQLAEAANEFRHALKEDDSYYPARVNLGNVLGMMGEKEAAKKELQKLLTLPAGNSFRERAQELIATQAQGS